MHLSIPRLPDPVYRAMINICNRTFVQDSSLIRATVYVGGHIDSGIERRFVKERRQGISNIPRRRLCNCFVAVCLNQTMARYRNVTIWARVHVLSGENVLSVVPAVTPLSNAHCTALTFVPRSVLGVCWCHNVPIRLLCILVYRGCLIPAIWQ